VRYVYLIYILLSAVVVHGRVSVFFANNVYSLWLNRYISLINAFVCPHIGEALIVSAKIKTTLIKNPVSSPGFQIVGRNGKPLKNLSSPVSPSLQQIIDNLQFDPMFDSSITNRFIVYGERFVYVLMYKIP